jgi:hypothetical protein
MIADISDNGPGHEALLDAIARQASRAPRQQLTLLLGLATVGAIAAASTIRHALAFSVGSTTVCAAVAALVLWELVRRSERSSAPVRASIQKALAALGVLLWFVGGMALLLALLGDPWQL